MNGKNSMIRMLSPGRLSVSYEQGDQGMTPDPVALRALRMPTKRQVVALMAALPSDEELRLLKRSVRGAVGSYVYPGARDADQPTEWHQAKMLEAFVQRLERARRLLRGWKP